MGRRRDTGIDGLLLVDKPAGWTSHDVVARCRGALRQPRAGHSGTLDPDATGLLLVGFGRVTRLLSYLTILPKTYTGEIVLGVETSTLDASGAVTARHDMAGVGIEQVRAAAAGLTGEIWQIPPMVSAVQIGGRRLHELAREGVEIERAPRRVTVHRFDVDGEPERGVFAVTVTCSSGTYVRTLAADAGTALGGGAHLRNLRRTRIGSFSVEEAHGVDALDATQLLSPVEALRDYPAVAVGDDVAALVRTGRVLPVEGLGVTDGAAGPWAVVGRDGALLAVYERRGPSEVKPAVVVAAAG